MIDLAKERKALVNEIELFIKESMKCFVVEVWADSYASIDSAFSHHITKDGEVFFLREQARQLWEFWQKSAELAQAEITELKQKLEKIESGEWLLVPRVPTAKMIDSTVHNLALSGGTEILKDIYLEMTNCKATIEAVEEDHE